MDFDITSSKDGDVLFVSFSGWSTVQNAHAMTRRYFEIVLGSDLKKVLVDIRRLRGRLSADEAYLLVRDLPVTPIPEGIKTALLETEGRRKFAHFLETTSQDAGVRDFRCFSDREQALAWLRSP